MRLSEATVAIVGLGLMGGSLALALQGRCARVVGVARKQETRESAAERGIVDHAHADIEQAMSEADVVVLATPVRQILRDIPLAAKAMRRGALLLDMGSTKAQIVAAMNGLPTKIAAVGGHPMCGKETGGLENADASLFRGATFVLAPCERTGDAAMQLVLELVEAIGAHPLIMDAKQHDRAVAMISHLPYLLAASLVHAEAQAEATEPLLPALAAGGFRDTTRLAASSVEMMQNILLTNRRNIEQALDLFEKQIRYVRSAMDDPSRLEDWMAGAQQKRREMFT